MSTSELSAACAARAAASALESLAFKLRDVESPASKEHAKQAAGAAKIAKGWARELDKLHRAKLRERSKTANVISAIR